jgi:hypothetical protein
MIKIALPAGSRRGSPILGGADEGVALKSDCTTSRFHVGQTVSVVAGTKDPDYDFPIEGNEPSPPQEV